MLLPQSNEGTRHDPCINWFMCIRSKHKSQFDDGDDDHNNDDNDDSDDHTC